MHFEYYCAMKMNIANVPVNLKVELRTHEVTVFANANVRESVADGFRTAVQSEEFQIGCSSTKEYLKKISVKNPNPNTDIKIKDGNLLQYIQLFALNA